jgi:hypothetical protein
MNIIEEIEQNFRALTLQKVTTPMFSRSDVIEISEELQRAQYQKGETALGKDTIFGKYAQSTTTYPRATKVSAGDTIKLKDSGDFYRNIKAFGDKEGILMDNKDSKKELLEEAYGDSVIGLHEESISELGDYLITMEIPQQIIYDNI